MIAHSSWCSIFERDSVSVKAFQTYRIGRNLPLMFWANMAPMLKRDVSVRISHSKLNLECDSKMSGDVIACFESLNSA